MTSAVDASSRAQGRPDRLQWHQDVISVGVVGAARGLGDAGTRGRGVRGRRDAESR